MESTSSTSSSNSGSVENLATKCNEVENKTKDLHEVQCDGGEEQPGPSCSTTGAEGGQNPIDPLIQRQRKDIVFELRRLKLGDRPVTGQGNREAVEQFFNHRYNPDDSQVPEQQRPEEVVVEVQGLVERRCVSSLLQTLQFRQRLEGALRSSLATVSQERNARVSGASATRSQSPQSGATDESPTGAAAAPANNSATPVIPVNNEPTAPVERAASWLQEHVPVPQANGHVPAPFSFETLQDMQRENVIEEISELVQQQLVTQTLQGSFRDTMENRILQSRLASSGQDGRRVQEFIQSLPRGQVVRNDFSHLNLPGPIPLAADALSDTVSVISATAAVHVTQSQSNTVVMKEMSALKNQIRELQNMMRLSFDMQLDVQRAIRQEVAAALAQVAGGATPAPEARHRPVNDSKCVICVDNIADTVMYQCGHLCTCYTCGMTLKSRGHHCPMCRAPIKDIIRAYKSSLE